MKFCDEHWATLRKAIDDAGMGDMVAESAEELVAKKGDPLMTAHNMILSNAMGNLGVAKVFGEGDACPLCLMTEEHIAHCEDPECTIANFDHWIGFAVRDTRVTLGFSPVYPVPDEGQG